MGKDKKSGGGSSKGVKAEALRTCTPRSPPEGSEGESQELSVSEVVTPTCVSSTPSTSEACAAVAGGTVLPSLVLPSPNSSIRNRPPTPYARKSCKPTDGLDENTQDDEEGRSPEGAN